LGKIVAKKQDATSEAQSVAFYAPQNPISQRVPPVTESRETTQKLSFGPKEVDWACSLQNNKTQLRKHKVVHFMHPKARSHNLYLPARESRETTQKLSFGPKKVDWASSLRKQDATSEAQSGAFYAPQNPISQLVPPGNGTARNHLET